MAHIEQRDYFLKVKYLMADRFKNKKVLDIGSLDINGNNRHLFEDCEYVGLDIAEGKNVDVISLAHEYNVSDETYDIIITNDCFEHDMFFEKTIINIVRMLKKGGLFLFTCKTDGAGEHGTLRTDGGFSSPLTIKDPRWANYYKNINETDVRDIIKVDEVFNKYEFSIIDSSKDICFYGVKNG